MYVCMYVCMYTKDGVYKAHEVQRSQHFRLDLLLREKREIHYEQTLLHTTSKLGSINQLSK